MAIFCWKIFAFAPMMFFLPPDRRTPVFCPLFKARLFTAFSNDISFTRSPLPGKASPQFRISPFFFRLASPKTFSAPTSFLRSPPPLPSRANPKMSPYIIFSFSNLLPVLSSDSLSEPPKPILSFTSPASSSMSSLSSPHPIYLPS